jgi:hypothetical protein
VDLEQGKDRSLSSPRLDKRSEEEVQTWYRCYMENREYIDAGIQEFEEISVRKKRTLKKDFLKITKSNHNTTLTYYYIEELVEEEREEVTR